MTAVRPALSRPETRRPGRGEAPGPSGPWVGDVELEAGFPQLLELPLSGQGDARQQLLAAPLPHQTCRGQGRDGQQTDTEDADGTSRAMVRVNA